MALALELWLWGVSPWVCPGPGGLPKEDPRLLLEPGWAAEPPKITFNCWNFYIKPLWSRNSKKKNIFPIWPPKVSGRFLEIRKHIDRLFQSQRVTKSKHFHIPKAWKPKMDIKMIKFGRNSGSTVSKYVFFYARKDGDDDLAWFLKFGLKIVCFFLTFRLFYFSGPVHPFGPFGRWHCRRLANIPLAFNSVQLRRLSRQLLGPLPTAFQRS